MPPRVERIVVGRKPSLYFTRVSPVCVGKVTLFNSKLAKLDVCRRDIKYKLVYVIK